MAKTPVKEGRTIMLQTASIPLRDGLQVGVPTWLEPNPVFDPTGVGWQEAVAATVVMIVALLGASLARRFLRRAAEHWPNAQTPIVRLLIRMAGWLILLLGATFALLLLGFELGPIVVIVVVVIAVLVVMGRPLLENICASVVLQAEAPFQIGGIVEVLGETGIVREISSRTTAVDIFDGRRIRVPNNQILNGPIVNLTERKQRRSSLRVGVEYGTDLDRARGVILATLADVESVNAEPSPEALVTEFGDSAIVFLVWLWHDPVANGTFRVTDEAARAIDRAFKREGIVIPLPQRVIRRGDANGPGM